MGKVSSSNSQGVRVPKLRFPGFDETWELSRLSDISYYQTGKDIVPKSKYVSTENMLQNFAGMEPYKDEAVVSGIPFASGDVLIANIRPYLKKVWKADFAGCCSTDVLVLHSANINPDYLYYNIAREDFITHVMSGVKGSKMPRGDKTQILEYKVGVPTHKEQQKIASILSLLDNRIVKQRQLVEALKSYKRGALSKLFPNKGKTTPEYRFRGFNEPWEQRKWNETVDISKEMVDPQNGVYNSFPHVAPGNIESFTGRLYDNVKTVEQEELISGKFHFHAGDIIYCKINPQLGKYHLAQFEGLTSADAYVLNAKNGIIQEFLYAILQTNDFFNYSVSVSKRSGMPKINREELNAYLYLAPSELEQKQIGIFMMHLDHLISAHRSRIDEYERLKAGLLQQLFI